MTRFLAKARASTMVSERADFVLAIGLLALTNKARMPRGESSGRIDHTRAAVATA